MQQETPRNAIEQSIADAFATADTTAALNRLMYFTEQTFEALCGKQAEAVAVANHSLSPYEVDFIAEEWGPRDIAFPHEEHCGAWRLSIADVARALGLPEATVAAFTADDWEANHEEMQDALMEERIAFWHSMTSPVPGQCRAHRGPFTPNLMDL